MGVHGLWKLIEPTGKQVPLENLENKVLAVDVSIWMYQLTKGLQTTGGEAVPNAHILGLFNRICKLLYYRIKPVFVFDGGVPLLKKETIEARKRQKRKAQETSEELREKLLNNLMKRNAVNQLLGTDDIASSSQLVDDMFALPPLPERSEEIDEFESDSDTEVTSAKVESFCDYKYGKNLHSIDVNSEHFKSLPPDIRHEILSELIETRKQNSWAKINEMPENSQDFSKFQLERLKKRRDVQVSLDEAAKEMGGRILTYSELEAQFAEEGIVTENLPSQRIVGDSVTRFLFITGKAGENVPAEQTKLPVEEEKPKENPAPKPSSQISASEFEKNIQVIEDCIFIKDSSSDDDYDMAETDIDYVRSLSNQEKLSQDEILKLIKQEQKSPEHSSSCIIESDNEEIPCTSRTAIERDKDDDVEIIEPSQKFEESRLSILSKKLSNVDKNDNGNSNVVQSQKENTSTEKLSLELFTDNDIDVPEKSASQDSLMCKSDEMVKTVMLPTSEEGSSPREFISEAKSMELFSESDSDDFIEVADNVEKSSYFKGAEKEIEITIDPNKIVEDDIFSDIFDTSEVVNETVISDRGDSNQSPKSHKFTSEIKLQNTLVKDVSDSMKDKFDQPPKSEKIPNQNNTILQSKPLDIPISENEKINEKTSLKESTEESAKTLTEIFNKVKKTEDFNKMKSQNVDKSPIKRNIPSQEELATIQKALNEEEHELLSERNRQERLGSTITQQMIIEAQELLQLFGIPYVVAPMEAEAQCAFLDQIDLTEGTITDDSDIWLFGGQKVYKNFFDNRKHVLQFRAIEIESFFKLSREQLIQMALLVGSDYTVGIEGIGPVTAIEILAYFSDPSNKPKSEDDIVETLRKFRIWLRNNKNNASKLARKCRNVNLSEAFPNISVVHAYLYPTVDDSKDGFTWAPPDLDGIRMFMKSKFGWKTSRIDDILLPVMKRLNNRNKQTTLDMYFKGKPFSQIAFGTVSKRVIQAINIMKSKSEEEPLAIPSTSKSPKKSPAKSNRTPQKTPAKSVEGMKSSPLKTPEKLQKNTPKKTRRTKKPPIIKKVPNALPVLRSSAPYFGEVIPQKEKDKMDAAKRKLEAVKIFQAKNKSKRNTKKRKVLPPKPDCSYLSESSAEEI